MITHKKGPRSDNVYTVFLRGLTTFNIKSNFDRETLTWREERAQLVRYRWGTAAIQIAEGLWDLGQMDFLFLILFVMLFPPALFLNESFISECYHLGVC